MWRQQMEKWWMTYERTESNLTPKGRRWRDGVVDWQESSSLACRIPEGLGYQRNQEGEGGVDAVAEGLFENLVLYTLPTTSLSHHRYEHTKPFFYFSANLYPSQGWESRNLKPGRSVDWFCFPTLYNTSLTKEGTESVTMSFSSIPWSWKEEGQEEILGSKKNHQINTVKYHLATYMGYVIYLLVLYLR